MLVLLVCPRGLTTFLGKLFPGLQLEQVDLKELERGHLLRLRLQPRLRPGVHWNKACVRLRFLFVVQVLVVKLLLELYK